MHQSGKRCLITIMSGALLVLGLSAAPATAAPPAVAQESGPFWPGNLLSMNNADFENGAGDWVGSGDVSTLTTEDATAFLHKYALEIVASKSGTSIINLSGAAIDLPGSGSRTFRVGAYINMQSANGHTAEFDLQCYNSSGDPFSWEYGTPVNIVSDGNWHWVEDDITVPSDCTSVQDSPQVKFTKMHAGGTIYMDEAWFAPQRAALMIGAYQAGDTAWEQADTTIGPLQSDKMFYGPKTDLPPTWESSANTCYNIEQDTSRKTPVPVCLIAFMKQQTESRIAGFLKLMPTDQTVIFIYHQEPEGDSFPTGPHTCDPEATMDSQEFICQFEKQAEDIGRAAAADTLTENVFTADDSASSKYVDGGAGDGCNWIVPSSAADFYFEDHYERGWANGTPLPEQTSSPDGVGAQEWANWLGCVNTYAKTLDKPIGLAEYGLCSGSPDKDICSQNQGCDHHAGSKPDDTKTMIADDTYLTDLTTESSGVSPTLLWEYWYDNCWQFTDSTGISKWTHFEGENGGAVGG